MRVLVVAGPFRRADIDALAVAGSRFARVVNAGVTNGVVRRSVPEMDGFHSRLVDLYIGDQRMIGMIQNDSFLRLPQQGLPLSC